MEETSGAVADASLQERPFSELISVWLDEGERLSASAAAAPAPPPAPESRLRRVFHQLRPAIERHRLFVLVGIGLLPLALILCAHRGTPAQAAASTVAAAPPVAASPSAQAPPPASAQGQGLPARVELASAASADLKAAPPHRHHHHHHHHAARGPSKTVASAGRATRR